MKTTTTILTIIATLKLATVFGQCTNQVLNLTGTTTINGIQVSVTSSGMVDSNSIYCNNTFPYFVGYNYISGSGNGTYTFNFSPAVNGITLNFSGISNNSSQEVVVLNVNGLHYSIPFTGSLNSCDPLAMLTSSGDIIGCPGCGVSGWNGTTISGPITSLSVLDSTISGVPNGAIFSLFFCDSLATNVEQNEIKDRYQLFPNPFSTQTVLHSDNYLYNSTLTVNNYLGQTVMQIKNITGQTNNYFAP
jgi:hypothetical protein